MTEEKSLTLPQDPTTILEHNRKATMTTLQKLADRLLSRLEWDPDLDDLTTGQALNNLLKVLALMEALGQKMLLDADTDDPAAAAEIVDGVVITKKFSQLCKKLEKKGVI